MSAGSAPRPSRIGQAFCLAGGALGLLGFAGWIFHVETMTTFIAGRPAMMPNTALALIAIGLGTGIHPDAHENRIRRIAAHALALFALAIAVGTLAEYLLGIDIGIDELALASAKGGRYPGRPSPLTAASVAMLGVAFLASGRGRTRAAAMTQALILGAAFLAFVSIVGHLYGAGEVSRLRQASVIGVALPTALALLLISSGMLLRVADTGLMRVVRSDEPGGLLVRRLGLVTIVVMPLLGVVAYRVVRLAGVEDLPLTLAVLTMVGVPLSLALIILTAGRLNRAHVELEVSRERARLLVEESADAIFVADLDGRYTEVNAAGCRLLDMSREDIIGKTILDLIPPNEIPQLAAAKELLVQGGTLTADWSLRRKDGTYVPVEVSAKILADGRWQGIVRDITRRKAAEEAARRAVERARFLADAGEVLNASHGSGDIPSRIAQLAVENIAHCCIIERPEYWHPVVRWADGDRPAPAPFVLALGVRAPMLIDEVTPEWLSPLGATHPLRQLVGASRRSLIAAPIVVGERVLGAMLLLSSEEHRYVEADLQLAIDLARRTGLAVENERLYQESQTASRARDEMLGIVAHDLRSPLTALQFGADMLANQVPEDRRATSRTVVNAIRRSVRHATRLVDDLLDVARIEEGRLTVVLKEMAPERIVTSARELFVGMAVGAAVRLEVDVVPDLGMVAADEDRLHQALSNLVDNAIKFTPAGGCVRLVVTPDGAAVTFAVIDSGPGILPEHIPRLFDRFWQAESGGRGAGLGLAIAKGIVEAHGGRIWAESSPGQGSTFAFTLPAVQRPER